MSRTRLAVTVGFVAVVVGGSPAVAAENRPTETGAETTASGGVVGVVTTDDGSPPGRLLVSLSGPSGTALAVPDAAGRFVFDRLIPGRYLLRTHLAPVARGRRIIEVAAEATVYESVVLLSAPAASTGVQRAGFGLSEVTDAAPVPAEPGGRDMPPAAAGAPPALAPHDHNAKAWRLRRARRSILKDAGYGVSAPDAVEPAARFEPDSIYAGQLPELAGGVPMSGHVQLLTRGTLAGSGRVWSTDPWHGQVASLAIAPRGNADWSVRGAFEMAAGRASSWVLAGRYTADPHDDHNVQVAMSYSKQASTHPGEFLPDVAANATLSRPSREVGSIDAVDIWSVAPGVTVDYGTAFARYGYLKDGTLLSPRAAVSITPFERTRVRVAVSQTMTAPGAEQFLPPLDGMWLPPERTFTSLSRFDDLQAERAVQVEAGVEQRVGEATVLGVRHFTQDVSDQLITMFQAGRHVPAGTLPAPGGHYYLTSASGVTVAGWAVNVSHEAADRVRGTVDYSIVRAEWSPRRASGLSPSTAGIFRTGFERFHDVTTTLEADIPETATRVIARCRVNNAFARADADTVTSGLDARFDVRVMQALPFSPIEGSSWELLLAVRSLFHEQASGGSVYDELLVVDPPRQFVGGLVVHF